MLQPLVTNKIELVTLQLSSLLIVSVHNVHTRAQFHKACKHKNLLRTD